MDNVKRLSCGECIAVCPSGTSKKAGGGYVVSAGGKLGRHPRLAQTTCKTSNYKSVGLMENVLKNYKPYLAPGERHGEAILKMITDKGLRDQPES